MIKSKKITITCPIEDLEFLRARMISPSKLFQDAILEYKSNLKKSNAQFQLEQDLKYMQNHYEYSLKPGGSALDYQNQLNRFLKKYPNWNKSQVVAKVQKLRRDMLDFEMDSELR